MQRQQRVSKESGCSDAARCRDQKVHAPEVAMSTVRGGTVACRGAQGHRYVRRVENRGCSAGSKYGQGSASCEAGQTRREGLLAKVVVQDKRARQMRSDASGSRRARARSRARQP